MLALTSTPAACSAGTRKGCTRCPSSEGPVIHVVHAIHVASVIHVIHVIHVIYVNVDAEQRKVSGGEGFGVG
ncbi:hypothetical protein [Streptomyces zagrosensis]|uniref:Uncharacterized protein n=1 Tax=Streptomyces zagrosensis TaxID=1042984 RepID=A0A7W9QEH2_9ACTN|nr:hypothetical protein [Streptomyces zagrosensis]MBB5938785.1 hypothetical protein [Streptomyces zagrosensis]